MSDVTKKLGGVGLTGASLKWIALVTMLLDHIAYAVLYKAYIVPNSISSGATLYGIYRIMRAIGRVSFPLFCFLITEGWRHTSNRARYAFRLFVFGLLSEIPYDLAFQGALVSMSHQNVFFTLFLGLVAIAVWDRVTEDNKTWVGKCLGTVLVFGVASIAQLTDTDYGLAGVLIIFVFHVFRGHTLLMFIAYVGALGVSVGFGSSEIEMFASAAFLLMLLYNGQRGKQNKYLFYVFYPAHLLVLAGLRYVLMWI